MIGRGRAYRPFARSGRAKVIAIFLTFGAITVVSLALSINATQHSRNGATIVEVVDRQRTLAERYLSEIQLVHSGRRADPALTAAVMAQSLHALLYGGTSPAVRGDDDGTDLAPVTGNAVREQLRQEARLVKDLSASGSAFLAHRSLAGVPSTAGEQIRLDDPIDRLRILGALTSNVALNTGRTIAAAEDRNIATIRTVQIAVQLGGLLLSLLLAGALIATTRRQSAHFRSLVTSSSDLVMVLRSGGCRYASRSLCRMLGRSEEDLLGAGLRAFIHEDDRDAFDRAARSAEPATMTFRLLNSAGEQRHVEAHLTDLRGDRHVRGVVVNARDITERVRLEREFARQSQRDAFGSQLVEALEMVDEEQSVLSLVERAMVEISATSRTELLLADSSRAHLSRVAASPTAGAPACPVTSPFSCAAVRRGQPVSFASSEALNACPKLRDRPGGACSAACVPVGFMGRALGVLHATGPDGEPPDAEQIARLTTLATQAGARIGTVRAFEKTQLQAATDALTGLINRRTIEAQIRAMLGDGRPFALAVADLDRFKSINDTFGHDAGDRALRLFAQVASAALREEDLLARWGGEEFVVVLPDIDRHRAVAVLERIRTRLAAAHTGEHPRFTASFGVADTAMAGSVELLMHIADRGLYDAKQAGRDRIAIGEHDAAEPTPVAVRYGGGDGVDGLGGPAADPDRPLPLRPLTHEAAAEPEPRPTGLEIR